MFDKNVRFAYPWRDYQARVLQSAQQFIRDGRLHVVAAPGSGKTVLGLELMRRIDKPTIILAPTIAIRNQWVDRFSELFVADRQRPAWVSTDINKPAQVTVVTYQGLASRLLARQKHAQAAAAATSLDTEASGTLYIHPQNPAQTAAPVVSPAPAVAATVTPPPDAKIYLPGEEPPETIAVAGAGETTPPGVATANQTSAQTLLQELQSLGVQTIVVDEAHHLRNEWWRALTVLREGLKKAVVVALTATPPYDADVLEWKRYSGFCGPVDIEVSVPELVARDELCAHQDYLFYACPSTEEIAAVATIRQAIRVFADGLSTDREFVGALLAHPVFTLPDEQRERIVLDEPEYFTAMGSFLVRAGQASVARPLLQLICGRRVQRMPEFDSQLLELLLPGVLYRDRLFVTKQNEALIERLRDEAKRIGVLDAGEVTVIDNKAISKILRNSLSKLQAISDIVRQEAHCLGDDLRCVVLTDYIRREAATGSAGAQTAHKLGVVPIFEIIRSGLTESAKQGLAVLTGTIVVLPAELQDEFRTELSRLTKSAGRREQVRFMHYALDAQYVLCEVSTSARQHIVAVMTALFTAGKLKVIIGTKSLLGEGWDAPAINTLILASYVGTSMLSNQMRGRAIRVYKPNPTKTANIWHVLTVVPENTALHPTQGTMTDDLGAEYRMLKRRFASFVAPHVREPRIESGLERASFLPPAPYPVQQLFRLAQQANQTSFAAAANRLAMRETWRTALRTGTVGTLSHSVQTTHPKLPRSPLVFRGIAAMVYTTVMSCIFFAPNALSAWVRLLNTAAQYNHAILFLILSIAGTGLVSMGFALRVVARMVRHFSPEKSMKQVGEVVLTTLTEHGLIASPAASLRVEVVRHVDGSVETMLVGAQPYESDMFLDALSELVSPIGNPRYIVQAKRLNRFVPTVWSGFAIPPVIGAQRRYVDTFLREWQWKVGPCRGVFTRSAEGRRILLNARRASLARFVSGGIRRRSVWT
jgi:superfamily II DNA or RNA helicase